MRTLFLAATLLFAAVTCIVAQGFDLTGFRRCAQLAEQRFCTENPDVLRRNLDAAVNCNSLTDAFLIANACARDSGSGFYCGAVYAYAGDIGAASLSTCSSTIQGGNCTSECRGGLTAIRENLGCCINAVVNDTASVYSFASSAFTYDLWSRCDVDPPSSTCSGSLSFTLPGSRQPSCTDSAQDIGCSQQSMDYTVDFINEEPSCANILQYHRDVCSRRDNGDYCINTIENDFIAFVNPILAECGPSLLAQTCSSDCKDVLGRFVDQRGCCVNAIFNSTYTVVSGFNFVSPVLANNMLFQLCEVEPPPLTCGSLPFRVSAFTLLIPLIIATVFGRKMM